MDVLSKLPSRQVLLSMLAGAFNAPTTKFAYVLNAIVSKFVYALVSLKNKKSTNS